MLKIPSQEELTSIVEKTFNDKRHLKEPVRCYQNLLNKISDENDVNKFIRHVFSSVLGEPNKSCGFICLMGPPYTAWIKSGDYSIKTIKKGMATLKKAEWDVRYPSGEREKSKEVLIQHLEYCVAKAATERGEQRSAKP